MSKSMNTSSVSPGLSDASNLYDTNSSYRLALVWSIEASKHDSCSMLAFNSRVLEPTAFTFSSHKGSLFRCPHDEQSIEVVPISYISLAKLGGHVLEPVDA